MVAAIREAMAPASLEHHKKIVAALERVSLGAAQRIAEALDAGEEINPGQLAIILGITVEKLQLLKGGVTQRVAVVDENPERRMIREALQRSLSQGPAMVFGAGKESQNAATALPPPSAVPCPPPTILEAAAVHIQSPVGDAGKPDSTTL
ncbi:MAG: hypothetical protein EBR88_07310 [Betaproteobacteria bacterium]|nr:hypothetical protein [Betaproteobacteria bacterium]